MRHFLFVHGNLDPTRITHRQLLEIMAYAEGRDLRTQDQIKRGRGGGEGVTRGTIADTRAMFPGAFK